MALNLMTPRYVAPDVTKAPLAAEAIRSSQATTNLAAQAQQTRDRAQQAQEQQFGAELGLRSKEQAEASAARSGNLALGWERADQGWEELGLRAEAQSVNLAGQEQRMRHAEDKLPFEIRGLNLANDAQDLKNELDEATLEDEIARVGLANAQTVAQTDALDASTTAANQQTNFLKVNHDRDQAQKAQFAIYQKQMETAVVGGQWKFVEDMVFPNVNPVQAQSLRAMQDDIGKREASIAAMTTTNRIHTDTIAQSTATKVAITKLPTLAMQRFWRQPNRTNFNGSIPYTDGDGELTAEGHAALDAQQEWLSLASKTTNINQLWTMPVGSATGQGWLHSGNSAGEKFLNGKMFIPTEDALVEARLLNAQQIAAFQANITPTEFEYEKHGVKVKGKAIGEMSKEAQQAHMDSVAARFEKLIATDEYTGIEGHRMAWAEAMMQTETQMGNITFVAPDDVGAYASVAVGGVFFDAKTLTFKRKTQGKKQSRGSRGGPTGGGTTSTAGRGSGSSGRANRANAQRLQRQRVAAEAARKAEIKREALVQKSIEWREANPNARRTPSWFTHPRPEAKPPTKTGSRGSR